MLIRSTLASLFAISLAVPALAQPASSPPGAAPPPKAQPASASTGGAATTAAPVDKGDEKAGASPKPAAGGGASISAPKPPPGGPPTAGDATAAEVGAELSMGPKPEARAKAKTKPGRRRHRYTGSDEETERRIVTFTDGPSPRMIAHGSSYVHGALELEVQFHDANPLCYAYSTNIGVSRVAANDQPLPSRVPAISSLGKFSPSSYADVDAAFSGVNSAHDEIDELLHAARFQVSLEDVWAACDSGAPFSVQRARVEAAAKTLTSKIGPGGSWSAILERAEAAALGAKRLVRSMDTEAAGHVDAVKSRQTELAAAERAAAELEAKAERSGRTRAVKEKLEDAGREIARAQRKLREAELAVAESHRAADLGRAAEQLSERVRFAMKALAGMTADVNRARALLARAPTAIRRHFGAGEKVDVVIERRRLDKGEPNPSEPAQTFQVEPFETLRPLTVDIGMGPAIGIGQNRSKYETVWAPRDRNETTPAWRVVRTDQGLNLDLMVTVSVYIWKRRYLDDGVFDAWQLLPRPLAGISVNDPFNAFYLGLQIDPVQYLNLMGGVRIGNQQKLIGPQPLDRALIDNTGQPQPPVTRNEVQVSGFIGFNVSTNLIYRWFKQGL